MTDESRRTAEEQREALSGASFLRDAFLGRLRWDLIRSYTEVPVERPEFQNYYARFRRFLEEQVDPSAIDREGQYPEPVVEGLKELGAFGLDIPAEYGGLGLSHVEYVRIMELLGSYDGNVTALLSAHQAIGVPRPVLLFGSEELKKEYLPRCARGEISGFALTEPAVGSDPARLETRARRTASGDWVLSGRKLWTTNGTVADLLVVIARDEEDGGIHAFVVETAWKGVTATHRCHFMGLRALENGVIDFDEVEVPARNRVGEEGAGLRIALQTLNTGRLTLPAATAGQAKYCLELARKWSNAREQWGAPIGKHEAITHKLADLGTSAFAMESVARLLGAMADDEGFDVRMESAGAKEWNTVQGWNVVDQTLQVRGGRGFETAKSLGDRGEAAVPLERLLRDSRINQIFEGSSEVLHLFLAREALDEHLEVAGALVDPRASIGAKLKALPGIFGHYAWWYPSRWFGWSLPPKHRRHFGELASDARWAERTSRRLARSLFHAMAVYRAGLEKKQGVLFRHVDVGLELFAVVASIERARQLSEREAPDASSARALARGAARRGRRRVSRLFRDIWRRDHAADYRLGREVLSGDHLWMEEGSMGLQYSVEDLRPPKMDEILAAREGERQAETAQSSEREP